MKAHVALGIAILLTVDLMSGPLYAKDTKKKTDTCPGGLMACVERCKAVGGQPRRCPEYCQKTRGC